MRRNAASLPPASFATNVRPRQKRKIAENRWAHWGIVQETKMPIKTAHFSELFLV